MRYFIAILGTFSMFSCHSINDQPLFNGDVYTVIDTIEYKDIVGDFIDLDSINAGAMHVYDSLLIFVSNKYRKNHIYVFNSNSGKHIGSIAPIGRGPNEFTHLSIYDQFISDSKNISVWVSDVVQGYRLINITESIKLGQTQIDSAINIRHIWYGDGFSTQPWEYSQILSDGVILAKSLPRSIINENNEPIVTDYGNFNFIAIDNNKEKSKTFAPFNRTPKLLGNKFDISALFDTNHRYRPHSKKIAVLMRFAPQLNILTIDKNADSISQVGYRFLETPDINDLNFLEKEPYTYYENITVSEKLIIGLYVGEKAIENKFSSNKIHIYNWNGDLVAKLKLKNEVLQIALNPADHMLFTMDNLDKVYKYDVSNLLPK